MAYAVLAPGRMLDVFQAADDSAAITRAFVTAGSDGGALTCEAALADAASRAGVPVGTLTPGDALIKADLTVRVVAPELVGVADDAMLMIRFFDAAAGFARAARHVPEEQWIWTAEIKGQIGELSAAARTGVIASAGKAPALYFTREEVLVRVRKEDLELKKVDHFAIELSSDPAELAEALEAAYGLALVPVPSAIFEGKVDPIDPHTLQIMTALLGAVERYWNGGMTRSDHRPQLGGSLEIQLLPFPDAVTTS